MANFDGTAQPITSKADVFAAGVLLAMAACYQTDRMGLERVIAGEQRFAEAIPAALQQLLAGMLAEDPAQRPSAEECLRHPFFHDAAAADAAATARATTSLYVPTARSAAKAQAAAAAKAALVAAEAAPAAGRRAGGKRKAKSPVHCAAIPGW